MRPGLLLLFTLLASGCVQLPDSPPSTPPAPLVPLGKNLTSDVVMPQNAHAVSEVLWDELDRETRTSELK